MVDLHIALSNEDYSGADGRRKAFIDILKALGNNPSFEEHRKPEQIVNEAEKKSDEECSRVYFALLKELQLRPEHKADLIKRGLSEEDIKRFRFRSIPFGGKKICASLVRQGLDLEGVPGFYKTKKGEWNLAIPGSYVDNKWTPDTGYLCPAYDGDYNYILGFQIRLDKPRDKSKYIWLSSAGREQGVSCGGISTYLPGSTDGPVIITEGILKALIVYCLLDKKISVLGVPGVNSIKSLTPYLQRLGDDIHVFEAYDMDKADDTDLEKSDRITGAAEKLKDLVTSYNISSETLKWDMNREGRWYGNFKGLDDFLAGYTGNREKLLSYFVARSVSAIKIQKFANKNKKIA